MLFLLLSILAWLPQHREAINQSEILTYVEKLTESTVLFHNSREKIISADIISISTELRAKMMSFLDNLQPCHMEWMIPYQYISNNLVTDWNDIQCKYAIKINAKWKEMPQKNDNDWTAHQNVKKCLKIWGFEPYISKALLHILTKKRDLSTIDESHMIMNNENMPNVLTKEILSYLRMQYGTTVIQKELRRESIGKREVFPSTPPFHGEYNENKDNHNDNQVLFTTTLHSNFFATQSPAAAAYDNNNDNNYYKNNYNNNIDSSNDDDDDKYDENSKFRYITPYKREDRNREREKELRSDTGVEPPSPSASSASSASSHSSGGWRTFRKQFAFQDRESGLFFQAFESEFRKYISEMYSVEAFIIDTNPVVIIKPGTCTFVLDRKSVV